EHAECLRRRSGACESCRPRAYQGINRAPRSGPGARYFVFTWVEMLIKRPVAANVNAPLATPPRALGGRNAAQKAIGSDRNRIRAFRFAAKAQLRRRIVALAVR